MKQLNDRERKDRALLADNVFQAMGDFVIMYGFEALMTVVGAGLVAAHELDDMPRERREEDRQPSRLG